MKKWIALVLWAFAGSASASDGFQPAWPSPDRVVEWQIANIDIAPAALVWSDSGILVVMERDTLKRTGPTARAWFRWEALSPETADSWSGRSLLVLREMDCSLGRARPLAMTIYAGNNLTGTQTSAENDAEPWTYDRPGKMGAAQTAAACEGKFLFSNEDVVRWTREYFGVD